MNTRLMRGLHHPAPRWRQFPVFLLLLAAAGLPCAARAQLSSDRAPIVVVSDDNYPPYIFRDASGMIRGILPNQWALWEQKTGVKVDLQATNWAEAQRLMREGRADVIDTIFLTEERARRYAFTPPYTDIEVPVYAHKTLGGISDIASLKGFTIGVKAGDAVIEYLKRRGIDSVKEYRSYEEIILAAKNQEIKVFSVDEPPAVYYLYKHSIAGDFHRSFVLYTGEFHRAVQKSRPDLLHLVQDGFGKISRNEYRAIDRKWMGSPFLLKDILRPWWDLILTGLAVILALALGNVLLGRLVHTKTAKLRSALEELRHSMAALQSSEEALRVSREYFATVFDSTNDALFIHDARTGAILDVNRRMCEMYGFSSREEALAAGLEPLSSGIPPYTQADGLKWMREALDKGPQVFEWQARHHDGHLFWVEVSMRRVQIAANDRLIVSVRDITDRKRAGQALATALERYNLLAKQNRIVSWAIDVHGLYTSLGAGTTDTTGRRPDMMVGKTYFYELHPDDGREAFKAKVLGYVARGESFRNLVHPVMTESGGITWFSSSSIPTRDGQGNILGAWGTSTDITDIKRAEEEKEALQEQLTQAQKLESVGRLAGGVAHDFNNMLQAILGFTEMALGQASPGQSLHSDLMEIKKAVQRSTNLISQLQAVARKQPVVPRVLNINTSVESMSVMLHRLIGKDIRLEWKPGRDLGAVMMDPGQFDQIVANLCVNARDAIGQSGHIAIETANVEITPAEARRLSGVAPGAYVLLSIRDDGAGMSPEIRDRVFEPFFTTKPLSKGSGLGLSIVYGIVRQNGGIIRVDSEPGKGTVFQIYLRRCAGEQAATDPAADAGVPAHSAHETILLVDDEVSVLHVTRLILENLGYQVLATSSPKEALRLFAEYVDRIDLLITDIVMPDMNGPELVRQMQKRHPKLKYFFISGHIANLLDEQGLDKTNLSCIQKPFSTKALAQKIRETLAKK